MHRGPRVLKAAFNQGVLGSIPRRLTKLIIEVLQRTQGQQQRAAALLGLTRFQLYNRLKRYCIEVARGVGGDQGCTAIRC